MNLFFFLAVFSTLIPFNLCNCITSSQVNSNLCCFCSFNEYFNSLFTMSSLGFSMDFCFQKSNSSLNKTIFISSQLSLENTQTLNGELVYGDLMTALVNESYHSMKYIDIEINFLLIGQNHYLIKNSIESILIFRQQQADIVIRPLYCKEIDIQGCLMDNDEKISVYIKTDGFAFFISKKFILQNLIIIASDLSMNVLSSKSNCLKEKTVCCTSENMSQFNSDCFISNKTINNDNKLHFGFFNLEMILDNPNLVVPQLIIKYCEFQDFYSVTNDRGYSSLVAFVNALPGNIFLTNIIIKGFYFTKGIIEQGQSLVYYSMQTNFTTSPLNNLNYIPSVITINSSQISLYNQYNILAFDSKNKLLYLEKINGNLKIFNVSFNENTNFFSLIYIIGSNNLTCQINETKFWRNSGVYLFMFQNNFPEMIIAHSNFSNNSILTVASLDQNDLLFYKNSLINSSVPQNNFIEFIDSYLIIDGCIFSNLWTDTIRYYMFESKTRVEETINIQMKFPDFNEPPFAKDILKILNSNFHESNLNLFRNLFSIISFEIFNCSMKNIFLLYGLPYISAHTERIFNLSTIFVENFQSNFKFIYLSYTRNIIFHKFYLLNSRFLLFSDIYSITDIEDTPNATKTFILINFSYFSNVSLANANSLSTQFFFINYYTLYHGFYFLNISNSYFENIFNDVFRDDSLFYFATAHNYISKSHFIDLANMTLFRWYVRVSISFVNISDSKFSIQKFYLARFYYVSITYNINSLSIRNTIFETDKPLLSPYSMEFLKVQYLVISNVTLKNIISNTGGSIRIYISSLQNMLIENSTFCNNSGFGPNGADLILQISEYKSVDFGGFNEYNFLKNFGIINCDFKNSKKSGSITLLNDGELLLWNTSFNNIKGVDGAVLNLNTKSNVLLWQVKVNDSFSSGIGGCFSMSESIIFIINSQIYNTTSLKSGGILIATKQSFITIINCSFELSFANEGGMIVAEDASINLYNITFVNSSSTFQGGFIYSRKSVIKASIINLFGGKGLTGSAIHGEFVIIDFEEILIEKCQSSIINGLGTIFLSGVDGTNNTISRMVCANNQGMTGACLYLKDIYLNIFESFINYNAAYKESVIVMFQESLNADLFLQNIIINENLASLFIIQIVYSNVLLNNISFSNNFCRNSLIFVKEGNFMISFLIFLSTKYSLDNLNEYLISLDSCLNSTIVDSIFFGLGKFGHLNIKKNLVLVINNSLFFNGNSSNGASLNSISNSLFINNSTFKNNYANNEGGAIYISGAPYTEIINTTFTNNSAFLKVADIYVENSYQIMSLIALIIKNSYFENGTISSIYAKFLSEMNLINCTFIGRGNDFLSQAFQIISSENVNIFGSVFKNYWNIGLGYFENLNDIANEISISNCEFSNSFSIYPGGLLYFNGAFNLLIKSSFFFLGETLKNGGAIAFYCKNINCSFQIEAFNNFTDNFAKYYGGGVYSEKTALSINESETYLLNNMAQLGNNIMTLPTIIYILLNLDLNTWTKNYSNYLNDALNQSENEQILKTKSGWFINLAIIITDHYNNIIQYDSDSIFSIKMLETNIPFSLENNIAKLVEGIALFNKLTIIADPGNYHMEIKSESINNLNKIVQINLISCDRGDFLSGKRCIECGEGFYSLRDDFNFSLNSSFECEKCPINAKCPGGEKIVPLEGFWRYDENSTLIIPCFEQKACPYQIKYSNSSKKNLKFEFECGEGYWGNLCYNCEKNFGKGYSNCFSCDNQNYYILFSCKMVVLLLMSIIEAYLVIQMKARSSKSLLKIFFYHNAFLITITARNNALNNDLGDVFDFLNEDAILTSSSLYSFHCFIYDAINHVKKEDILKINFFIQIIFPLLYTLFTALLKTICDSIYYKIKRKPIMWFKILKVNFLVLFFISYRKWYPRVALCTFIFFQCIDLGPGLYVSVSPDLACFGKEHQEILITFALPCIIIWSIGIPCLTYFLIRINSKTIKFEADRKKSNFNVKNKNFSSFYSIHKKDKRKYKTVILSLASDYKEKFKYWQVFEFLILTILLLSSQISNMLQDVIKRMVLFVIYGLFFLIYLKLEPYKDRINNKLICLSLLICQSTLIFEIIGFSEKNDSVIRNFAKNIILIINCFFFLFFFVALIKKWFFDHIGIFLKIKSTFKKYRDSMKYMINSYKEKNNFNKNM